MHCAPFQAVPMPPAICGAPSTNYYATAVPLSASTGSRNFATGEAGTIFYTALPAAPPADLPLGAVGQTPIQ